MKKLLILSLAFLCISLTATAQEMTAGAPETPGKNQPDTVRVSKNFVKVNLSAALLKNFSLQYERVLSKGVSVALSARYMPESNIPYADFFLNVAGADDPEIEQIVKGVLVNNFAVTPEIRFYTGKKKYGNGFYFSLYYRYGNYSFKNALVNFENNLGEDNEIDWSGDITSHSGGLMIGAQWSLGRYVCLDWWILGLGVGISSGDILGIPLLPLSEEDQQSIEDGVNDVEIPLFEPVVDVTADKASVIFDGPWAGIRGGLSIGIKF